MSQAENPTIESPFDPVSFVKSLTSRPGVYRMLDAEGTVIYVGKAKNLKNVLAVTFAAVV